METIDEQARMAETVQFNIKRLKRQTKADFCFLAKKLDLKQGEFLAELMHFYCLNNKEKMERLTTIKFQIAAPEVPNFFEVSPMCKDDLDLVLNTINADSTNTAKISGQLEYLYNEYIKDTRRHSLKDREAVQAFIVKYRKWMAEQKEAIKKIKESLPRD